MARGFESKSVTDQQEAAFAGAPARGEPGPAPRRRKLELARADLLHRMETAANDRYREMLKRALADVDKELAALR
jgi:hypothetical protein